MCVRRSGIGMHSFCRVRRRQVVSGPGLDHSCAGEAIGAAETPAGSEGYMPRHVRQCWHQMLVNVNWDRPNGSEPLETMFEQACRSQCPGSLTNS
jgi:hypothetical protein